MNLKWLSVSSPVYALHYAPGSSPSATTFFAAFSAILRSEVFGSTRRSKPSPSKSTHEVCRESHQSFVVASFAVLSNSAPKRGSRLVNFSDFGRRSRSARTDKLANTRGQRQIPPELRGRFISRPWGRSRAPDPLRSWSSGHLQCRPFWCIGPLPQAR